MNKIFLFAVVFILTSNIGILKAQNNGKHLEPVNGIFGIYDFQFEYYSKVRKILFDGLTDSPEIRFQVLPSFSPEKVLDIQFDRTNSKYYIVYQICDKMIWYNDNWEKVKVKKYKTQIDKESVELIKSLFEIAISKTKYPESETMGLDGANYYFSINKFGLKTGTVWSPPKESQMRKLVEIGYKLIELAINKSKMPIVPIKIDGEFKQEIEKLISELK